MRDIIKKIIGDSIKTKEELLKSQPDNIAKAASIIVDSLNSGCKLLVFGNGGSAADSQHIVAELVGRFKMERKPIAAIALTTNTSSITAIANDYGYDAVFTRQIMALGKKGDVAFGISTSGNSPNVLAALKAARSAGMKTIGLTGGKGGKIAELCDVAIVVAAGDTPRIQESHITIGHILCELIEKEIAKK